MANGIGKHGTEIAFSCQANQYLDQAAKYLECLPIIHVMPLANYFMGSIGPRVGLNQLDTHPTPHPKLRERERDLKPQDWAKFSRFVQVPKILKDSTLDQRNKVSYHVGSHSIK